MGYQLYKLAGAAWVTFVLVYLPLVLLTERFTIIPDTGWEIALLVGGALLGGIGPHGPREGALRNKVARGELSREDAAGEINGIL